MNKPSSETLGVEILTQLNIPIERLQRATIHIVANANVAVECQYVIPDEGHFALREANFILVENDWS